MWHCASCLGARTRVSGDADDSHGEECPADIPAALAKLRSSVTVYRRIPKPARVAVADGLARRINEAVVSDSNVNWWRLLSFAYTVLRAPGPDEEKHGTHATIIKRQAAAEAEHGGSNNLQQTCLSTKHPKSVKERPVSPNPCQGISSTHDSDFKIARRVESKCADGDIGGALRVLVSTEQIAVPSDEVVAALRRKHPPAPGDVVMPPAPTDADPSPLMVTTDQVRRTILSMPTGSSGGLDGVRPIHLQQLTAAESAEAGMRLLASLASLSNLILAGKVPQCARDALFSASLCALRKKDGGIRPIAVGSTLRRLPARIAAHVAADLLGHEFRPVQLGVGTQLGCEAAVHGVREFVSRSEEETTRVVVKVDVKNAFNSVRRDVILSRIRDRCPALYPMVYQAYASPTPLLFGDEKILSATGVQQGDPLGPLCFALAVDRCARSLTAPLNVWYLDDATLGGSVAQVTADLKTIISAFQTIGLQLNPSKCEVTVLNKPDESPSKLQCRRCERYSPTSQRRR